MARLIEYTNEDIIASIEACCGMIYHASDLLGCHPDTIYGRAEAYPEIWDAVKHARSRTCDDAESELRKAIKAGELQAVMFWLKHQGKDRGYGVPSSAAAETQVNVQVNVGGATVNVAQFNPHDPAFLALPVAEQLRLLDQVMHDLGNQ